MWQNTALGKGLEEMEELRLLKTTDQQGYIRLPFPSTAELQTTDPNVYSSSMVATDG